jgi:hypothetical protein
MMQWLQTAFHWAPFSLSILLGIQLAIFVSAEETAGMIHGHLLERANRKNNQRAVQAASTARLAGEAACYSETPKNIPTFSNVPSFQRRDNRSGQKT